MDIVTGDDVNDDNDSTTGDNIGDDDNDNDGGNNATDQDRGPDCLRSSSAGSGDSQLSVPPHDKGRRLPRCSAQHQHMTRRARGI